MMTAAAFAIACLIIICGFKLHYRMGALLDAIDAEAAGICTQCRELLTGGEGTTAPPTESGTPWLEVTPPRVGEVVPVPSCSPGACDTCDGERSKLAELEAQKAAAAKTETPAT